MDTMNKSPKEEQAATEGRRFEELVNGPSDQPDAETEKRRIVKNSDNDHLFLHEILEGYYVDEVNGAGAAEVAGYIPTRHELVQLVKYWYGRLLDDQWFRFLYSGSDSREFRIGRFAPRRIRRAAAAIGQEEVDRAIKQVKVEFKAKLNDTRLWEIFENGTDEQWDAVRNESWRPILEDYAEGALKRLERLEKESPGDLFAVVLAADTADPRRVILISPTESKLNGLLQASGQFEIEADRSKGKVLMGDRHFERMGFLHGTSKNGELLFDLLDSRDATFAREFLEGVADQIKKALNASRKRTPSCLISPAVDLPRKC
jgi:hypothetical protein